MADSVLLIDGVPLKIVDLGDGTFALADPAGVGAQTDISDRAARDLGKVDVALLDQYTPIDVDTGAGTVNALPVALRAPGAGGVTMPGDAANGLDVDVTRVADGADVALGASTVDAAPAATVEDSTARTGIGLFKGIKNLLKLINDKLVSGTDIGDVTVNNAAGAGVYVQPGTSAEFAATVALNKIADGANITTGAKADGVVDVVMDTTPLSLISILKSIHNRLYALVHTGITAVVSGTATVTQGTAGAAAWPVVATTGAIHSGAADLTPKYALANVAASQTDASIVAAVAGKKIRVMQVFALAGATATTLVFNSKPAGAGVAISPTMANGINGGEVLPFSPMGWFETVAGEGLTVTTGAGSTTGILVGYVEV